jgi:rubrerythrin
MRGGKFASLKWVKPKKVKRLPTDLALLAATPVGRALREVAAAVGIPRAGKVTRTPQEQAVELLQAAAEVEQALLVEYLYAAYSIDPAGPAAPLRKTVVQIAKEEMGHLITVQNLLLALGEDPYFDRESVPLKGKPAGQYPFPMRFEPFSGDSLAKYVTTESMPLEYISDADLRKKLQPIFKRAKKAAGTIVNHVGLLYAKIFWLFQPDDAPNPYGTNLPVELMPSGWHIPDKALKGLADPRQATASEFGRQPVDPSHPTADPIYVIEIRARDHALFALALIAAQGEGYSTGANSHFARFLKGYDDFAGSFPAGVWPVPVNPNTAPKKLSKPEAEAGRITHPKAVRWARLFDVRYQLLLLELWLGVWTDHAVSGPLGRDSLFNAALDEMLSRIARLAGRLLPGMDLKEEDNNNCKAGAPFGLPDDPLPRTEKTVKARMKQLLADAEELAVEIEQLPAPNAPTVPEKGVLKDMRDTDKPLRDALAST